MVEAGDFADDRERYRLESRIATGGMGEVWRASDTSLGRTVAVKLLKPEYTDDADFRARFETEARNAASLHHPGIAAVYDFGEAAAAPGSSTRPYLVMELVDGQPLSDLLRPGQPMDTEVARELLAQAAEALAAAHAAGIVHRDVKPANLLVTPDRRVKITDFGIARAVNAGGVTQTGQVMGTPQYLSPEQARGLPVSPASDVYALGVVAFECLAGRRPFTGDSPVATALAHLREPVPELPGHVPGDLADVVRRALAKEPGDRFADGGVMARALRDPATVALPPLPAEALGPATAVLGVAPAAVPVASTVQTSSPTPERDRRRRGGWLWALLALLVLAALALVIYMIATNADDSSPVQRQRAPRQSSSAPASSGSTAPATVQVVASRYIGRDYREVSADLKALGLRVSLDQQTNTGTGTPGTVTEVNPTGTVEKGSVITVRYLGPTPSPTPTPSSSAPPTTSAPTTPTPSASLPTGSSSAPAQSSPTAGAPSVSGNPSPAAASPTAAATSSPSAAAAAEGSGS